MRAEAEVGNHSAGNCRIEQLPQAESATQVNAARAGNEDGVVVPSGWLFHERHDQNEDDREGDRGQVIDDMKRRWIVHEHGPGYFHLTKWAHTLIWLGLPTIQARH